MVSSRNGSKVAAGASPRIDVSLSGLRGRNFSNVDELSIVAKKVSGVLETEKKFCDNCADEGVEKTELVPVTNCCSRTTAVWKGDSMMAVSIFISLLVFGSHCHINTKNKMDGENY